MLQCDVHCMLAVVMALGLLVTPGPFLLSWMGHPVPLFDSVLHMVVVCACSN
jgi:hypothetical protein